MIRQKTAGARIWGDIQRALPVAVTGVLLGISSAYVMLPRPVEPVDVPIPGWELEDLETYARLDREAFGRRSRDRAPAEILAIGSAYVAWNEAAMRAPALSVPDAANVPPPGTIQVGTAEERLRWSLRDELRASIGLAREVLGEARTFEELAILRSFHAEKFLAEIARAANVGRRTPELNQLAGALVDILQRSGWVDASLLPTVPLSILRARFKLYWTSVVFGLEDCDRSGPALCYGLTTLPIASAELRSLLLFLVNRPVIRPQDVQEMGTADRARDRRRLVYIDRLLALDQVADPSGVKRPFVGDLNLDLPRAALLFRTGNLEEAEAILRGYLLRHPTDGRAKNWLLAVLARKVG